MKIYYSVSNGGDGSAYPKFFENSLLADMHQSFEDEWGEPCTGSLYITGENIVVHDIMTSEKYLKYLSDEISFEDQYGGADYLDDGGLDVGDIRLTNRIVLMKRYARILKNNLEKK